MIQIVSLVAVLVLLAASTILIANTIRLSIFARRREIEVMKLVGATNWFVRGPFMLEGLLTGLAGSVAAVVVLFAREVAVPQIMSNMREDPDVHALASAGRRCSSSAWASRSAPSAPASRSAASSGSSRPRSAPRRVTVPPWQAATSNEDARPTPRAGGTTPTCDGVRRSRLAARARTSIAGRQAHLLSETTTAAPSSSARTTATSSRATRSRGSLHVLARHDAHLLGEIGPGGGWLARGQRLLESESVETAEHGYMLLPLAFRLEAEGKRTPRSRPPNVRSRSRTGR